MRIVKKTGEGVANMGRGAEGVEFGKGCPPPNRGWAQPLPRKKLTLWLKIVHFGVYSDKNSQFSIVHVKSNQLSAKLAQNYQVTALVVGLSVWTLSCTI